MDNLERLFSQCVAALIEKYYQQVDHEDYNHAKRGTVTDLMNDLHNVALDM